MYMISYERFIVDKGILLKQGMRTKVLMIGEFFWTVGFAEILSYHSIEVIWNNEKQFRRIEMLERVRRFRRTLRRSICENTAEWREWTGGGFLTYCTNVYAISTRNVDTKKQRSKLHYTTKSGARSNYAIYVCNVTSTLTQLILHCRKKLRIDNNHSTDQFCNVVEKEV